MNQQEKLNPDHYYHIYNRGINGCNLYQDENNYKYFLKLYDKHISPIAHTYAWVLMPNHFHLLIKIRNLTGFENLSGLKLKDKPPHQHFSNLFNAYTKAFNKYNNRHGSLFERPFKRKPINTENYLKQLILYIHNNPVHHGFVDHPMEYPWSSYHSITSTTPTKVQRETVKEWFGDLQDFKTMHADKTETKKFDDWFEIK